MAEFFLSLILAVQSFFGFAPQAEPVELGAGGLTTFQGGTGTTSPSGILYGDETIRLKTVTIGSNLTFSGGTLSATGGSGGSGTVSTSTNETAGYLSYWTTTSGTPAKLGQTATSSLLATSPLSLSGVASIIATANRTLTLDTSGAWSGTAGALAANAANCSAGSAAGGVSAAGAAEDCTDYWTEAENTAAGYTNNTGTVTSIATTWPITGGTITTTGTLGFDGLSTTTNSGMSAGNLYVGSGGIFQTAASSSIFGYTPLNPTRQITVAGTANQITSSAGAQDLSADRTWTLSLPSLVIFPSNASSTLFSTTYASSTNQVVGNNLTFGGVTADTWPEFCATITGSADLCDGSDATAVGAANPFTWEDNYAAINAATTSILWAKNGLNASSTSHLVNASTTLLTATDAFIGDIYGTPSSLFIANNWAESDNFIQLGSNFSSYYSAQSLAFASDGTMTWKASGDDYKFQGEADPFYGILDFSPIAASDKTFSFPNITGTVALGTGVQSNLAYWTNANTLTNVATTSLTASGVLTLSQPISVLGSSASALTLTGGSNGQFLAWLSGVPTWSATTSIPLGGDVTGTLSATVVGDNSHAHDSTTISGIDISADTNLTAGDALTLNDDDIDFDGGASPGGSLGGTWASPTIDDLFLLNNGDTGTGSYIFDYASTTGFSTAYASSTLYYGAGLANCNTENMLTWTDGRFGCEADTAGAGTSAFEIATTSDIAVPNLAYFTNIGGRTTLGSVATGTISSGVGISLDNSTRSAIGGALQITNSSPLSGLTANYPFSFSNPTLTWSGLSTTTNSGMSAGNLYVGSGGIFQTAASSSIFGYTPLNPTRQLTVASGNGTIVLSAGTQDLSADRTWTLTYTGLATTSQPAAGDLLVSNGGAGVFGIATGTLSATSPIALSDSTRSLIGGAAAISIANAVSDGSTKGAASFTAADFNDSSGNISIDYTNGQAASASAKGFLTAANWTTFNNKWDLASTTIGVAYGGTGVSTFTSSQLLYGNGTNALTSVATSSIAFTSFPANLSGTLGTLVGGSTASLTWWGLSTSTAMANTQIPYGTAANTLGSEAAFAYNSSTDKLSFVFASSTSLSTSAGAWFATGGGSVGVGTTSPTKLFSVHGESWVSATSTVGGLNVLAPTTGTSTIYMYSKSAGFGGQIILEDTDAAGCTAITALNGTVSGVTVTCPTEI